MENTTFRFQCYKVLLRTLGRIDAICTFSYLAVLRLQSEIGHENSPHLRLGEMAKEYSMVVNHIDKEIMPNRLTLMYILAVYSQLEEFLKLLIQEHPNSKEWERKTDEDLIKFVLRSVVVLNKNDCEYEREIVDYYRLVRNRFMHPGTKEIHLENQLKKLKKIIPNSDYSSEANLYHQVNHSDFDLFTRAVKVLAEKLCIKARPTDDQIVEMAKVDFKNLNKYRNNLERYRNALSQKFCMVYSLKGKESDEIVTKYMGC